MSFVGKTCACSQQRCVVFSCWHEGTPVETLRPGKVFPGCFCGEASVLQPVEEAGRRELPGGASGLCGAAPTAPSQEEEEED